MIDIYLKDHAKGKKIEEYLLRNPYVESVMDMTIGWCDLNFELMVKNVDTLTQIIEDIDNKFPGVIRRTNFWISKKIYKERWLPEVF